MEGLIKSSAENDQQTTNNKTKPNKRKKQTKMKLNKTEATAFEAIGAAICGSKSASKDKKNNMPLVSAVLTENRDEFVNGVVIGNYKFSIVSRDELTAIRI